jgi:hypothetical protein
VAAGDLRLRGPDRRQRIGDSSKDFYGIRPERDGLYKNRTGAISKIQAVERHA